MGVGVFGKLPARRDYVQQRVDPGLMALLDPWLQRAVADSRRELGDRWLDTYLGAPIWRFWLGRQIAGSPALGAIMPSVDGVGRYFPLAVLATFDTPVPPPEIDEHARWFAAAEALLLAALAEDGTLEALVAGLDDMPEPATGADAPPGDAGIGAVFAAMRRARAGEFYATWSCWWSPSPDDGETPPRALMRRGLPSPVEYAAMIAVDPTPERAPVPGRA